jgi:hypothetical protein
MTVWGFVGGSHYTSRDDAGAAEDRARLAAAGARETFTTMADVQRRLAPG